MSLGGIGNTRIGWSLVVLSCLPKALPDYGAIRHGSKFL